MTEAAAKAPNMTFGPLQTGFRRMRRAGETLARMADAERAQLPLWLPVALGLGVVLWFELPGPAAWTTAMLAALALALGGVAAGWRSRTGLAVLCAGLAVAAGVAIAWSRAERLAAPVLDRPVVTAFAARVTGVEPMPARAIVRLRLAAIDRPELPPQIRVNVASGHAPAGLSEGAVVRLRARLLPPAPPALPGGYDFARTAWFMQLGATGSAIGPVLLLSPGEAGLLAGARRQLSAHVQSQLDGSEGAIAAALATGDEGGIAEADAEAMRRSGLAHLLSISGLHVTAMVAGVMIVTLKLLALSPWLALRWPLVTVAAGAGALAGVGYTLLTGAEVPTVRSCIAALIVLAGIAMGRDAITMRLVAAGALIVLLLWPESITGPSFQLSFAAVMAIVALHESPGIKALLRRREESRLRRMARGALGLFLTGLAVEAALMPIALAHFHKAGVFGALANMVAIPLTTLVVMPAEALALLLDAIGLGAPAWWVAGQALSLLLWIAHLAADAPGSVIALPEAPRWAFALFVAGMLWFGLWRSRMRWWGLAPAAVAVAAMALAEPPDLLLTGDGRHLAVRTDDGGHALLRPRAGEYSRDMLAEHAGVDGGLAALDAVPGARCGRDACVVALNRAGRRWVLLATRSGQPIDRAAMEPACAAADIVVSDRSLPGWCRPSWIRADRAMLQRTGGLAIDLKRGRIDSVSARQGRHPWIEPPAP